MFKNSFQEAIRKNQERRVERKKDREVKVDKRRSFRLERIDALKEKFYAVAAKRKWLFFLIAALIVGYIVVSSAGVGSGIIEKVKSFFI